MENYILERIDDPSQFKFESIGPGQNIVMAETWNTIEKNLWNFWRQILLYRKKSIMLIG